MPVAEEHFTAEHDIDSQEHQDELDRVSKEERNRADKATAKQMADIIQANTKVIADLKATIGVFNVLIAKNAILPKVSEHPSVVTSDPATGKSDLTAKERKVEKVIGDAQAADKKTSQGTADLAKMSKTLAALGAIMTAGAPLLMQAFQVFRNAMAGEDISGALGDMATEGMIIGLVQLWQNQTDNQYWDDFANFFLTHTAVQQLANGQKVQPDPTSADLVMILHYSSILNPVGVGSNFSWASAKEKSDAVDALKVTYSTSDKGAFIRSLAGITVNKKSVPRGIQAQLGELAVAGAI